MSDAEMKAFCRCCQLRGKQVKLILRCSNVGPVSCDADPIINLRRFYSPYIIIFWVAASSMKLECIPCSYQESIQWWPLASILKQMYRSHATDCVFLALSSNQGGFIDNYSFINLNGRHRLCLGIIVIRPIAQY